MKRATRVPASTVVRMNSASKRMAKWYQSPIQTRPPNMPDRMCAIPTASVGAPPVRDSSVFSPTSWAIWLIMSGGNGEAPAGDHLRRLRSGGTNQPARAVQGEIDSGLDHGCADQGHDGDERFR